MMQVFNGSFVAIVTPMHEDGSVDFDSLSRLIEWHIESKTDGIVVVGTTGESATLSVREHIEVIKKTVEFVDKRILVIAGSGSNSTAQAVETTMESKIAGVDGCLLVTPYYNRPSQKGLIEHYIKIANSVEIPQILYNVPTRTSCDLLPETVETLSKHRNIVGLKEAIGDKERINKAIKISKKSSSEFSILSGDDPTFLDLLQDGGHGVISVAANVIPAQIAEICNLAKKNLKEARNLNERYKNLYNLCFIESNPVPVKWMLNQMDLIQKYLRLPLVELDSIHKDNIKVEMRNLNLL